MVCKMDLLGFCQNFFNVINQKEQATDLLFLIRLLKNHNNHKLNLLSRLLLF